LAGGDSNSAAIVEMNVRGTLSQDPVDQLIRELIQTNRPATEAEAAKILVRMAAAPFDPTIVPVRLKHRGLRYHGNVLATKASSLDYHLVQRVFVDRQWVADTTATSIWPICVLRWFVRRPRWRCTSGAAATSRRWSRPLASCYLTHVVAPFGCPS
jgi:hypothetical protein